MEKESSSFGLEKQVLEKTALIILYFIGAFISMMLTYDLLIKIIPFGEARPFLEEISKAVIALVIINILKIKDLKKAVNSAFILGFVFGFMESINQLAHNGFMIFILQNITSIGHGLWTTTIIAIYYRFKPTSPRNILKIIGSTIGVGLIHFIYNIFMKAPISPIEFSIATLILLSSAVLTDYTRGYYQ